MLPIIVSGDNGRINTKISLPKAWNGWGIDVYFERVQSCVDSLLKHLPDEGDMDADRERLLRVEFTDTCENVIKLNYRVLRAGGVQKKNSGNFSFRGLLRLGVIDKESANRWTRRLLVKRNGYVHGRVKSKLTIELLTELICQANYHLSVINGFLKSATPADLQARVSATFREPSAATAWSKVWHWLGIALRAEMRERRSAVVRFLGPVVQNKLVVAARNWAIQFWLH